DQRDRNAPENQAEREVRGETLAANKGEGRDRAEQPADAHGRIEEADARLAEIEELEGCDDDQDVQRTRNERLDPVQDHNECEVAVARDGTEAAEELTHEVAFGLTLRWSFDAEADQKERRRDEGDRGGGEDGLRVRGREEDAAKRGPEKDAGALDSRQNEVRAGRVLGRLGRLRR